MTFHRASVQFRAAPKAQGYQWPADPLASFLRQNASHEDLAFTQYMLGAYQEWKIAAKEGSELGTENGNAGSASELTDASSIDRPHNPFDALDGVPDATMRGFIRLLSHRIPFATAAVLTGLERSEVEAMTTSLQAWLSAAGVSHDLATRIRLGFDPLASELACPHCQSDKPPVFFGLSWHHIQLYRCDACSNLFEAHQGLAEGTRKQACAPSHVLGGVFGAATD